MSYPQQNPNLTFSHPPTQSGVPSTLQITFIPQRTHFGFFDHAASASCPCIDHSQHATLLTELNEIMRTKPKEVLPHDSAKKVKFTSRFLRHYFKFKATFMLLQFFVFITLIIACIMLQIFVWRMMYAVIIGLVLGFALFSVLSVIVQVTIQRTLGSVAQPLIAQYNEALMEKLRKRVADENAKNASMGRSVTYSLSSTPSVLVMSNRSMNRRRRRSRPVMTYETIMYPNVPVLHMTWGETVGADMRIARNEPPSYVNGQHVVADVDFAGMVPQYTQQGGPGAPPQQSDATWNQGAPQGLWNQAPPSAAPAITTPPMALGGAAYNPYGTAAPPPVEPYNPYYNTSTNLHAPSNAPPLYNAAPPTYNQHASSSVQQYTPPVVGSSWSIDPEDPNAPPQF